MFPETSATDRIFCHFVPLCALLTPPKNPKNQNFEKMKRKEKKKKKKRLQILQFYTNVPKIMITRYTVPEIWHMKDVIVIFHFGLFFALLPP